MIPVSTVQLCRNSVFQYWASVGYRAPEGAEGCKPNSAQGTWEAAIERHIVEQGSGVTLNITT